MGQIERLVTRRWISIGYSQPYKQQVLPVEDFAGLAAFDERRLTQQMMSKVDSLEERIDLAGRLPAWAEWSDKSRRAVSVIAGATMNRLSFADRMES